MSLYVVEKIDNDTAKKLHAYALIRDWELSDETRERWRKMEDKNIDKNELPD